MDIQQLNAIGKDIAQTVKIVFFSTTLRSIPGYRSISGTLLGVLLLQSPWFKVSPLYVPREVIERLLALPPRSRRYRNCGGCLKRKRGACWMKTASIGAMVSRRARDRGCG
jgi:hypothetical protein